MAVTTDLEKFRVELGDLDDDHRLFTDDQATYYLEKRTGSVDLAVADACDALARRYARLARSFEEDGQRIDMTKIATAYREQAKVLRSRAGGIGVVQVTKVDGYSEDVTGRDGAGNVPPTGHVRAGYWNPDQHN